jgi:hypothetical protein
MKIIITEDQYNNIIPIKYKRRIASIIGTAEKIIDNGDFFWEDVDFCAEFDSYDDFIESLVSDMVEQYEYEGRGEDYDIYEFVYDLLGYDNFVEAMVDHIGDKIKTFYFRKTKDC